MVMPRSEKSQEPFTLEDPTPASGHLTNNRYILSPTSMKNRKSRVQKDLRKQPNADGTRALLSSSGNNSLAAYSKEYPDPHVTGVNLFKNGTDILMSQNHQQYGLTQNHSSMTSG